MSAASYPGKFIVFEGGEGAGKTTQINRLADLLKESGIDFVQTREPGGTVVGEAVREILLDKNLPAMHSDTELLLMFAARAEHLQHKILPALAKGQWVVSDRFVDASYAYQGYGRGIDHDRLEVLENWVLQKLQPDLVIVLDIDVATGMQRVGKRGATDRFEEEQLDFFERVRAGYLDRAKKSPGRYAVLDASVDEQAVTEQLNSIMQPVIDGWLQQ